MIFYGWKEKTIHSCATPHHCSQCSSGKLVGVIMQKYFHIYWVPMFPLGKKAVTVCTSCRAVQDRKASPGAVTLTLDTAKKSARAPLWTFSGLVIIGLIIGAVSIIRNKEKQDMDAYMTSPKVGDVVLVKMKEAGSLDHTLLKVVNVEENDIALIPGRYQFNFFGGDKQLREKTYEREADYFVNQTIHVHALHELDVVRMQRN